MKPLYRGAKPARPHSFRLRMGLLYTLLVAAAVALVVRAVDLQLVDHSFLAGQGEARFLRVVAIAAHRGTITDRTGEPLAVSTPVESIWINPQDFKDDPAPLARVARALGIDRQEFIRRVSGSADHQFLYLARDLEPDAARKVRALGIDGLNFTREYRRYYPAGEVTGHVLGFTNVDDVGQEGAELAFDNWLAGADGAKRVIQDRNGRQVEDVESIRPVRPGRDLALSLDLRIQYLAYRELKEAVQANRASSGSVVVLDIGTGEVLAMVNQPSYNPNDRDQLQPAAYRNRAVTDMFEPGSSIKPFVVAAALASGRFSADSLIDTNPGYVQVGTKVFEDEHNLGVTGLATILAKSSNVGMAKIALQLAPQQIWSTLMRVGFGQVSGSGFPGESGGLLTNYSHWRPITIATLSHGYGISVTTLQLAEGYAVIGALGIRRPVSLLRVDSPPGGQRVLPESVCRSLLTLLQAVVTQEGATGVDARIPGYRVAGKTGTVYQLVDGAYSNDVYRSVFAGIAPASHPRLVTVVTLDQPSAGKHTGGTVAAPVFARVMGGALRLMGIAPDDVLSPADEALQGEKVARR